MCLDRVLLVLLMVTGLWAAPSQAGTVRAAGSGIGIGLVRLLAEQYQAGHPGDPLWIPESVGTSGAVKGLASGKLDIGILARPLKPSELEGGVSVPLCRTPLVFFTGARRKDVTLIRRDLSALFNNSLPAFPNGDVRALLRPPTDAGFIRLLEIFPDLAPSVETARQLRGAVLALTDQEAMDMVESSRSLVAFGALTPMVAERRKLTPIPLDGVMPSAAALESGRYTHDVPLVLVLPANASPEARAFVDYARSPAAAALLRANECLPVASR